VDVRTPGERQDGYVPGSTYLFLPELLKKAERLDKSRPVAIYCDSGYRASLAASLLLRMGFKDVHNVPGSWKAWKALGYEVQTPKVRKKGTDTDLS
jgi:hydroxyacylglutathione hydrolase